MDISLFDYHLPPELIAQRPAENRSDSRLMIINRESGVTSQKRFTDFPTCLHAGDCLVINDTRVFPARLLGGRRQSGGAVEICLVRPISSDRQDSQPSASSLHWLALARPSARLNEGEEILFGLSGQKSADKITLDQHWGEGVWRISFASEDSMRRLIESYGCAPLPPYIQRQADESDSERYQTVYADKQGAVAAPTAGLHFTHETLETIRLKGIQIVPLTLHVGPGTFKPVTANDTDKHVVDPEWAELTPEAASAINGARRIGGSIVAVGTTVTRVLEYAAQRGAGESGRLAPFSGMVDLYIQPGFEFRVVDELLTNFHLPKSSLLLLVSAFAGRALILKRYQQAVEEKYRFFSYGDCMFIHRRDS